MTIRAALVILVLARSTQVAEAADLRRAPVRQFSQQLERQAGLRLPALGNSAHRQLDCDPTHGASCRGAYWGGHSACPVAHRFGL